MTCICNELVACLKKFDTKIEECRCMDGGEAITTPADNILSYVQSDIRFLIAKAEGR